MKIALMQEDYRDMFLDMDPLGYTERDRFPGRITMVATVEDDWQRGDQPAGLIVVNRREDRLVIEWLCVREKFRTEGVGEALLDAALRGATAEGLSVMSAYINDEYGRDIVCPHEREYLLDHMFEEEEELSGEWIDEARMVLKCAEKESINCEGVLPVSKMSGAMREQMLAQLHRDEAHNVSVYPVEDAMHLIDPTLSGMILHKDDTYSVLLAQKCNDTIYPVVFSAKDDDAMMKLLVYTAKTAEEAYGPKTLIRIIESSDRYTNAISRMMPDHIHAWYLTGSIDLYNSLSGFTDPYKTATLLTEDEYDTIYVDD